MKIYERIIKSPGAPSNTSDLWLDTKQNPPALKCFHGGEWVPIASVSEGRGEIDPSEDSDVVRYSDYCLFTVDPNKPTITKNEQTWSFYPDANADNKRSLVISKGTFIIEDNERISLINSSYTEDYGLVVATDKSGNFTVLVISSDFVEQASQMYPELGITGPGFLLTTPHRDPSPVV